MSFDRPFVDRRVTDVDAATEIARGAAREWGLGAPALLRVGMNAIFATDDAVVRVGHATAPASSAHALARVLMDADVPVVPPLDGCAADVGGVAVTAWERARSVERPTDWRAVGSSVARIHAIDPAVLPPDYPLPSPDRFPWWDFDALLDEVSHAIDEPALVGIRRAIEDGRWWTRSLTDGAAVCHGDVHPGNVMMTADGPLLIDFDLLCLAPPAWDHAMLTTYADRWGGPVGVYDDFAAGYGRSLSTDELTTTIASLRNVAATLMRVRAGLTDPRAHGEADRRLRFWRGDPDAPVWRAQ